MYHTYIAFLQQKGLAVLIGYCDKSFPANICNQVRLTEAVE